jgi:hypothetical protein
VIGEDLHFTLGASKIWGLVSHNDYLLIYFIRNMEVAGLLDIEQEKLTPTWRNKRIGEERIAKRLVFFLIS